MSRRAGTRLPTDGATNPLPIYIRQVREMISRGWDIDLIVELAREGLPPPRERSAEERAVVRDLYRQVSL